MFKVSGTEVVQKGTDVGLVVVPKVTLRSLWYRNGYVPKCSYPVVLNVTGTERDLTLSMKSPTNGE